MPENRVTGLSDSRVLITGAARGIGLTMAKAFLSEGARVYITDISADALEESRSANDGLAGTVGDVASTDDVARVFDDVERELGGLDILVNNAGIAGPTAELQDVTLEDWQRTLDVNITGPYLCSKFAIPLLRRNSTGSIINIISSAGVFGYPLRSPYTASKWAMVGITKTLAMELGPHGIRVNAVAPGSVSGARIDGVIEREAEARDVDVEVVRESYLRQNSLRTFVSAQDVANLVLFACSDQGCFVSGQVLSVDGHTETLAQF
jgi:NAD(P)-dependent dehydrogenase (short-subunit alcohol dehydrogenase family)